MRERGLKPVRAVRHASCGWSLPMRERGLKQAAMDANTAEISRSLHGSVERKPFVSKAMLELERFPP